MFSNRRENLSFKKFHLDTNFEKDPQDINFLILRTISIPHFLPTIVSPQYPSEVVFSAFRGNI